MVSSDWTPLHEVSSVLEMKLGMTPTEPVKILMMVDLTVNDFGGTGNDLNGTSDDTDTTRRDME